MRENFLIDNFIEYYRMTFLQKIADGVNIWEDPDNEIDNEIMSLLPDKIETVTNLEKVDKPDEQEVPFRKFFKGREVRDIDIYIDRPFIEVVTLAFYFTNEAKLQNQLLQILHRICT